ncbi:MAG: protein-glutamate O-methyltransferase CheR [Alphaproteobacteria bacterium]
MTPATFQFVKEFVKKNSGLDLGDDKKYLVENRLMPIARLKRFKDIDDLVTNLRTKAEPELVRMVTEAMTTNESFFFRDTKPFDQFKTLVLPHLIKTRAGAKSVRIWSAACSTGQEPYSLAMILREHAAQLAGWRIEIVGTDLSTDVLEKAKAGSYSQFEVQRGLPIQFLVKYFKQNGDRWQIDPSIRAMVQYKVFNLLQDPGSLGRFDVVFCRNVLIYFDNPTKGQVLAQISKYMPDDGFLYLGGAETVLGVTDKFVALSGHRGIYVIARGAAATQQRLAG